MSYIKDSVICWLLKTYSLALAVYVMTKTKLVVINNVKEEMGLKIMNGSLRATSLNMI